MSDKFFSNVQLLCGFNGADAATAFTDESSAARVATFVGNAQLDTAQTRFGSASLLLDGSGDAVTFPDAAAFTLGSGDFTVEAWIRFATDPVGTGRDFLSHWDSSGGQRGWIFGYSIGTLRFPYSAGGGDVQAVSVAWVPAAATWYHVAASRIGTSLRLFVDGALLLTNNIGANSIFNTNTTVKVGAESGTTNSFNGWIDEARITVGVGRYAAAFRPPRGPYDRGKRTGVLGKYFQPTVVAQAAPTPP